MITVDGLTYTYPGGDAPAVTELAERLHSD